jgi:ABC-type phosphate/phosphonate transport system substrate-binding protein
VQAVADLRGKTVGVGAVDSPQATLLPLLHLEQQGLVPGKDFQVRYFDVLGGKHGDHIGGERDAARALVAGEIDAACMIDGNHLLFSQEGTFGPGFSRVLTQTAPYDHCNFTVLADGQGWQRFVELLKGMSYADPEVRPLLDLEGLKAWKVGRVEGYKALDEATTRFGFYDAQGRITASNYQY